MNDLLSSQEIGKWEIKHYKYVTKCDKFLRTVSDRLQNSGNVDSRLVLSGEFSPPRPVLEALLWYVILWHTAKQRHHSLWRIKETLKLLFQLRVKEHVQQFSREEQQNAFAALEVISLELISWANGVQQDRSFGKFCGRFQDLLQVICPLVCISCVEN